MINECEIDMGLSMNVCFNKMETAFGEIVPLIIQTEQIKLIR